MAHKMSINNGNSPLSHVQRKLDDMANARKHSTLTIDFDEGGVRNWQVAVKGHRKDRVFSEK